MRRAGLVLALVFVVVLSAGQTSLSAPQPMSTAFTYQGRLMDGNGVADGLYDLRFRLYDSSDPNVGTRVGRTIDVNGLDVISGYFTSQLDFGRGDPNVFNGDARWLEIAVRPGGANKPNGYTILLPRQEIMPVPYCLLSRGIFVDRLLNVGIGTADPVAKLDLIGPIKITDGNEAIGKVLTCMGANGLATWKHLVAGPQGPPGPQGPEGPQGPRGDTGPKGDQGPEGLKGDKGDKGEKGDMGPQGLQGPPGDKGDKGDTGSVGAQGQQGPPSPTGPKGDQGDPGPAGATGDKGDKGDQGDPGPMGLPGPQGPKGDKGDKGDTGSMGPQGLKGDSGATGPQGPQGLKGDKGDKGDIGSMGPEGPQGPAGPTLGIYDSLGLMSSGGRAAGDAGNRTIYNLGNVGIGTMSPSDKLQVQNARVSIRGNTGDELLLLQPGGDANSTQTVIRYTRPDSTDDLFSVLKYGEVHMAGSLYVRGTASFGRIDAGSGERLGVNGGRLVRLVSSRRYKTNIRDLQDNAYRVLNLRPVRFQWKTTGEEDIGLIAEDVAQVIDDLVIYDTEGRPDAVKYDKIALYLLSVVKAQQQKIAELEAAEAQHRSVAQRVEALEQMIRQQKVIVKEVQQ